ADDTALSELGLALGERHRYNTDRFLSLGQPPGNCGLAAWRIAWHSAHLRRGRSWLFGLAGADKLTPVPASVRARQSRPALPANRHAATPAARCRKCRRGRFIFNLPLSSQHSITPSAANSSLSGTRRPRSPAVGALTTNSNFAACPTGRSAGFSPLRIRPV